MSDPLPSIEEMTDSNDLTSSWWAVSPRVTPPEVDNRAGGKTRVVKGEDRTAKLGRDLKLPHGKGFRRSDLVYRRQLACMAQ